MKKILLCIPLLLMSACVHAATQVPATQVTVNTSNFSKNLNSTDNTVQKALNTVDQVIGGSGTPGGSNTQYQINNNGVFGGGNMYNVGNNVGVGSSAPGALLDVAGSIRVQGFALTSGSSLAGKILTSDANGNGTWQNNGATGGGVGTGTQGDFPYYASTGNNVSDQSILTLNAGGNIGIGTPGAIYTLQVNGSIGAGSFVGPGIISGLIAGYIPVASTPSLLQNSVMQQINSNIGIGTPSAGQTLVVNGTVKDLGEIIGNYSGILKTTSGTVATATSGTDYAPATSGTSILKGNGSGGFSNASAGTDYQAPLTFSTGLTNSGGTVVVNNSQNITQLSNLTSNGCISTISGNGTLSVVSCGSANNGLWETNSVGIDTFQPYVGIGSTNPGQRLDVNGTLRGLGFQGDSAGLMEVSTNQGIGMDPVNSTYTTPLLLLTTGSNVGISSATPGQKLDVNGTVRMTGFQLGTSTTNNYVLTANSSGVGTWQANAGNGTVNSGTTGQVGYYASSTTAISGSSAMYISGASSGNNIGIGSATPGENLDVFGTARATQLIANGTGNNQIGANLGIGSSNPGQALDVQGTIRASLGIIDVGIGTTVAAHVCVQTSSAGSTFYAC